MIIALATTFVACEELGLSVDVLISKKLSKNYEFTDNGTFTFTETDAIFNDNDLADINGNVESVTMDSLVFFVDSTSISNNDSLPFFDGNITITVETVSITDSISGSFQELIASNGKRLNVEQAQLEQIAAIVLVNSNSGNNTNYSYSLAGTVDGAPFTGYFTLQLFGEVEAKAGE